ncbi:hypothetical protein COL940_004484 [Colletotrichum noveboracense]|nr:hypothetical protein COL940_004484 [Colletotrichum noveboracense]
MTVLWGDSVDIYEAILTKDLTAGQRAQLKEVLADAKVVLERARGDQSAIDRETSKKLRVRMTSTLHVTQLMFCKTTMTMSQMHNARIQEIHDRLQAEAEAEQRRMRFLARLTLTDLFGESLSWATAVAAR